MWVPLLLATATPFFDAHAAWPPCGVALSTDVFGQDRLAMTSDGSGGAIVAWRDTRGGIGRDIFARRVDASGTPLWDPSGVIICTAADSQDSLDIVADGVGGAILTWQDFRSGTNWDIYVQRIDAEGNTLWTADGVPLCTAVNDQETPVLVSDYAGGAIVAWRDNRAGQDIYVRRVNSSGAPLWADNGVALCVATNAQALPRIVSDGTGGAIVTWRDPRNGTTNFDVYARRITASGTPLWTTDGVAVCSAAGNQLDPVIASDEAGGAVIAWMDLRNVSQGNQDLYAQRIDVSGQTVWPANGIIVSSASGAQVEQVIVSDRAGGAVLAWLDTRTGDADMYAQRVDASGTQLWTPDGIGVCTALGTQARQVIASDLAGGAIIAWEDWRNGDLDVYAQRVNASGNAHWTPDGFPVCVDAPRFQSNPDPVIASDGAGGAIVAWSDDRAVDGNLDVYARRVQSPPAVSAPLSGVATASLVVLPHHPNPVRGIASLELALPSASAVTIGLFDVAGRKLAVRSLGVLASGWQRVTLDASDALGAPLPAGIYFYQIEAAGHTLTRKMAVLR
ncbi:MAG: T9SS type A sorting domain-containing protein [Candidatus Eiseniibacteriota bacterium]